MRAYSASPCLDQHYMTHCHRAAPARPSSPQVVGKTLAQSGLLELSGLRLCSVVRSGGVIFRAPADPKSAGPLGRLLGRWKVSGTGAGWWTRVRPIRYIGGGTRRYGALACLRERRETQVCTRLYVSVRGSAALVSGRE